MRYQMIVPVGLLALASCASPLGESSPLMEELQGALIYFPSKIVEEESNASWMKRIEERINAELETPVRFRVFGHDGTEWELAVEPMTVPSPGNLRASAADSINILAEIGDLDVDMREADREIVFREKQSGQPVSGAYSASPSRTE